MGTTGYAEEFETKVLESGDDARVDNYQPSSLSKKLVRKQDLRIVPLCAGIYLLCFLDRSNIGNAKVLNEKTGDDLLDETHMSDTQCHRSHAVRPSRSPKQYEASCGALRAPTARSKVRDILLTVMPIVQVLGGLWPLRSAFKLYAEKTPTEQMARVLDAVLGSRNHGLGRFSQCRYSHCPSLSLGYI